LLCQVALKSRALPRSETSGLAIMQQGTTRSSDDT